MMKLALKLSLFLMLGMCLMLAIDSLLSIRRELRLHAADMEQDHHVTGQVLARAIPEVWSLRGQAHALAFLDQTNRGSRQVSFRWIDFDAPPGGRFAPQLAHIDLGSVAKGHELQGTMERGRDGGQFFSYLPVRVDGVVRGALELSETIDNESYVRTTLTRRVATATVLACLSGLIAMLVGGWFVGRPIRNLVGKARRIAAGDFSRPLGLRQGDEIGEVAREIDTMCEQLASAHERIVAETAARIEAIERMRHADRLATVGKLASGVAHEIGTPLNVASHRAKMIASGEVIGADAAAGARVIADQVERITSVVRQLLGFARFRTPQKAGRDLATIARQTVALLAPLAASRGVQLTVDEGEGGTLAQVDAGQIQQALTNLVMNGIQAMEKGGEVSIKVGTRVADHDGAVFEYSFLSVQDQGSGVSPEVLPHVFEPFFTTKDVGKGTGLGLAVAYGIVRDHGGWIDLVSIPGSGSCFTICLPRNGPAKGPECRSAIAAPAHDEPVITLTCGEDGV